jgi:hypothetical protein
MTMSTRTWKRTATGLIAGAAAALMIGQSAAPALAATPTWSVKPGGNITAKSGTTILKDLVTHLGIKVELKCTSSTTKTTLKKGHKLAGAGIGTITALSFVHCTGPDNISFTVGTPKHMAWKLNAAKYNAKTGTTTGSISGIHTTLSGPGCQAVVDGTGATKNNGTVPITYVNRTHKLSVLAGGNLHVYGVQNCFGLIANGDHTTFTATYTVSPAQTITSP